MLCLWGDNMSSNGHVYHVPFEPWDKRFNSIAQNAAGLVVQADGHELEVIERMFPALTPKGIRVAVFHGDIARTILSNIGRVR